MEEQIKAATDWVKATGVRGCVTGSSLLGYFPDSKQDIDVFLYNTKSFTELFYKMYHDPMFTIVDKLELWKADQFRTIPEKTFSKKFGLTTIKFMYNTCVPVNIISKQNATDIFSVLSSFDMDIICKGYDIETKQTLNLSENLPDKAATWNKWNTSYSSDSIWDVSRILRQMTRCFKYHDRGYNTDAVVVKYIELLDQIKNYENIFSSVGFDERLEVTKSNTKIVKKICQTWLKTHKISDESLELLTLKIKEI